MDAVDREDRGHDGWIAVDREDRGHDGWMPWIEKTEDTMDGLCG